MINSALFKSAGIYTLTNIINAAIPFLLMPVLTRYLNPVDYGITAMLQVLIGFITPFVGVNVHGAVSVKYFKRDQIDFPKYVSSCLMILMLTSLLMSVIVCIFQDQISSISQFPVDWLWTILLICFSQFTISILLAILQSDVQPKTYGIVQVLQTTMNLSLTIWLVVIHGFNWQGRVIAQTATVVCFAVFSIIFLYRRGWLVRGYDKAYIKDALNFGVPLIPHSIAGILMVMADRIIITQIVGVIDTGIYTVGAQIGMVIGLLETSVNQAYVPWLYDKLSKITDNAKHQIVQFTYSFAAIIFFIAITFSLIMPYFLKYFVGKEFYGASNVIIWVAIGYAFNGMYKMTGIYFCYIEKTKILSYITFLTALIHIIITYYAVKIFGAIGAGYAITITYLLKWLLTWYISARMYPMPWCESIFKVFK
jgi:O-antigen/teichoic acid export membrane protein